ncbi:MAG: response regulator [Planctomycetota bacterium]|nr:response regulator [Planctomycetota bacterium]
MSNRMLIVDDALIMRKRIRDIATRAGWIVVGEAANGAEALEFYAREKPDLTTLDIVMPEMDGVTALKRIRESDPSARVVMISAVDQREKLTECIQAGALDFIVKPFDAKRLASFFDKYLVPST